MGEKNLEYYNGLDKRSKEYRVWIKDSSMDAMRNAPTTIDPEKKEKVIELHEGTMDTGSHSESHSEGVLTQESYDGIDEYLKNTASPALDGLKDLPQIDENLSDAPDKLSKFVEDKEIILPSKVGDTLADVLKKTGIEAVVKFFTKGKDCNCKERQEELNLLFGQRVLCLEEEEYNYLHTFFSGNPSKIAPSQYIEITKIAGRILNKTIDSTMGCGGCVREIVNKMKQIYGTYEV